MRNQFRRERVIRLRACPPTHGTELGFLQFAFEVAGGLFFSACALIVKAVFKDSRDEQGCRTE
jgi:hypothetical protein